MGLLLAVLRHGHLARCATEPSRRTKRCSNSTGGPTFGFTLDAKPYGNASAAPEPQIPKGKRSAYRIQLGEEVIGNSVA
jgi:hypothetical protein